LCHITLAGFCGGWVRATDARPMRKVKNLRGRIAIWGLIGLVSWCSLSFARDMEQFAEEIEPNVAALRGLPFLAEVEKMFQSPAELRLVLRREIDRMYPGDTLHHIEKRLLKFGFVASPVDLNTLLTRMFSQQIAGYYDPILKKMVLIAGNTDGQGLRLSLRMISRVILQQLGLSMNKVLLAHELTHVIQDQHFDLMSLPLENLEEEDMSLAARALIEGDATLVMMDYILSSRAPGVDATSVSGLADNMRFWAESPLIRGMTLFQAVPRYLMDGLVFPYIDGFEFVLALKQQEGWEAVNKAYKDVPVSTEQILHPEKYIEERDDPVHIQFPALTEHLPQWQVLEQNTIGEFNIQLLLDSYLPLAQARVASAGWGGDRFILLEEPETEHLLLVWYTTWDTAKDAEEFFHIYENVLEKRYGNLSQAVTSLEQETVSRGQSLHEWGAEPGNVVLEIRGRDVLMIDGVSESQQQELLQWFWSSKKIYTSGIER